MELRLINMLREGRAFYGTQSYCAASIDDIRNRFYFKPRMVRDINNNPVCEYIFQLDNIYYKIRASYTDSNSDPLKWQIMPSHSAYYGRLGEEFAYVMENYLKHGMLYPVSMGTDFVTSVGKDGTCFISRWAPFKIMDLNLSGYTFRKLVFTNFTWPHTFARSFDLPDTIEMVEFDNMNCTAEPRTLWLVDGKEEDSLAQHFKEECKQC